MLPLRSPPRAPRRRAASPRSAAPRASSRSALPLERSSQGIVTSITVKTSTPRHRGRIGRSSPRHAASGTRIRQASPVRRKTSVAGVSSRTATRMSRYGIPQITHIAPKSSQPRRVTGRGLPDAEVRPRGGQRSKRSRTGCQRHDRRNAATRRNGRRGPGSRTAGSTPATGMRARARGLRRRRR